MALHGLLQGQIYLFHLFSLLKVNCRFGGTCRLYLQDRISQAKSSACYLLHAGFLVRLFFDLEDGGDIFLGNRGWLHSVTSHKTEIFSHWLLITKFMLPMERKMNPLFHTFHQYGSSWVTVAIRSSLPCRLPNTLFLVSVRGCGSRRVYRHTVYRAQNFRILNYMAQPQQQMRLPANSMLILALFKRHCLHWRRLNLAVEWVVLLLRVMESKVQILAHDIGNPDRGLSWFPLFRPGKCRKSASN
jgi:hypothetical protein